MYSDDSAASEIASDDEQLRADGAESDVASEVDESGGGGTTSRLQPLPTKSSPPAVDDASDAYDDDAYEDDDDGYSVDFEEEEAPPSPKASAARRVSSPPASPPRRPAAIDEDEEYSEASFEDESRRSASASARLVVDLSVPSAKGSPARAGSKPPSPFPNSPNVDLKVLSKPVAASGGSGATSPQQRHQQQMMMTPMPTTTAQSPRPYWFTPPPLVSSHVPLADGEEKKFSLLLRKVESKFEDEVEELREKNTLLQWKERELRAELRMHKDELKMRKARIEKKRKRALERRREHERLLDKLRAEVRDATTKHEAVVAVSCQLEAEKERLSDALATAEKERRAVEERNLELAEKLQATLGDFHALNLRFETAVGAQLAAEKRADDAAAQHQVELQVMEYKGRLELEAAQRALAKEVAGREAERATLPESHRAILAAEKERFERLEAALEKQLRELETQAARDALRLENAAARALEQQKLAEAKAEQRVLAELQAVRACLQSRMLRRDMASIRTDLMC